MPDPTHSARPPLSPLPLARWLWALAREVVNEYIRDGVGDLAASITFWTLLSIPAAVLALVSALSSVERFIGAGAARDLEQRILDFVNDTFADSQTLNDAISELFSDSNRGVFTIATLVAFFTLSRGFAGLIRALDSAYEVEEGRAWWHVRLVAMGLGGGTIVVTVGALGMLAVLPDLPGGTVLQLLVAPGALLLIVLWTTTLFHIGPNHRTPWRYDVPGGVFTALSWVLATQGFALYVRVASAGNQVQSAVGAVLLALTLMYLLSVAMLVGAQLNDVLSRRAGVVRQPVYLRDRYEQVVDKLSELRSDSAEPDGDNTTEV
ncbi:MAG: YihY/virulence factor BrkB family protein [Acidimicrobiales bacterium]